jgi:hypothetical protein
VSKWLRPGNYGYRQCRNFGQNSNTEIRPVNRYDQSWGKIRELNAEGERIGSKEIPTMTLPGILTISLRLSSKSCAAKVTLRPKGSGNFGRIHISDLMFGSGHGSSTVFL